MDKELKQLVVLIVGLAFTLCGTVYMVGNSNTTNLGHIFFITAIFILIIPTLLLTISEGE